MTDTATREELAEALRTAPWAFQGRSPDARELMDWLDQQTQPIAEAYIAMLLRNAERGAVCIMAEHDAYPAQAEQLCRQVVENLALAHRFRTAWESARRRAAGHRAAGHRADVELLVGLTEDLPVALVLDEHRETVEWEPADPQAHPRHTNDLREPSILLRWDNGRPWWLCHVTGLVHTEGPCILRDDPLDLRAGEGPASLTRDATGAVTIED